MWLLINAGIKVNPCYCPGFQFVNSFSLMVGVWWKPWYFCSGETCFLWYRSQIQVYTHERNIVSCVKNIGTSGEKRPCYLDTTKTMSVCACLFSTTCSWLDLAPLHAHGESSIINVCTMSKHLVIHLVVFEGEYIVRWYQFQHSAGHSTEWRNIVFDCRITEVLCFTHTTGRPTGTHFPNGGRNNIETHNRRTSTPKQHRPLYDRRRQWYGQIIWTTVLLAHCECSWRSRSRVVLSWLTLGAVQCWLQHLHLWEQTKTIELTPWFLSSIKLLHFKHFKVFKLHALCVTKFYNVRGMLSTRILNLLERTAASA